MLKNDEIDLMEKIYDILVEHELDQKEGIKTPINDFWRLIYRQRQEKKKRAEKSNAYNKANREKNREKNAEYMKSYYDSHKEEYRKYAKNYYHKKKNERLLKELREEEEKNKNENLY